MLVVFLQSVVDGLIRCWRAAAGHLVSYTVFTHHLITQMLLFWMSLKFKLNSILKSASLKISVMFFRIQSVFRIDVFLKIASPSSLYKPVDCLSSLFDNKNSIWMPTSSQILAISKLPMVTSRQLSVFFASKVCYHCITRISYNVLLYVSLFLEHRCIADQTGCSNIQLNKFTLWFIFNKIKPFNDIVWISPMIYLEMFYKVPFYFF